jgi:CRISPR-associated exonuclease Cas4
MRAGPVLGGDAADRGYPGRDLYHAQRRRHEVIFDQELRRRTAEVIAAIHAMFGRPGLPQAPNDARCPNCSLINLCIPKVLGEPARLRGLQGALFHPFPVLADSDD